MAKLVINNDKKMSTIAPEIYGHFSEHLGSAGQIPPFYPAGAAVQ